MYDWKAKITRVLELPGLTDEQKGTFDMHIEFIELSEIFPHSGLKDVRNDEQLIRLDLERLIETRGMSWSVRFKSQATLNEFQGPKESFGASLGPVGLSLWIDAYGATPAQALCDALLSAVKEAQQ